MLMLILVSQVRIRFGKLVPSEALFDLTSFCFILILLYFIPVLL